MAAEPYTLMLDWTMTLDREMMDCWMPLGIPTISTRFIIRLSMRIFLISTR